MVLNTISYGSQIEQEGYDLRRIAVELAIPCLTSLDTAREVLRVMAEAAGENRNVEAIQDYIGEN
jgi:carbamoyl-phosphate synthase large chain